MRKEINSLGALREKIFGVQSIGGGFWLQTMIVSMARRRRRQVQIADAPHR